MSAIVTVAYAAHWKGIAAAKAVDTIDSSRSPPPMRNGCEKTPLRGRVPSSPQPGAARGRASVRARDTRYGLIYGATERRARVHGRAAWVVGVDLGACGVEISPRSRVEWCRE